MNSKVSEVKGFTLIELLVVIAIVAILSVVVILSLNPAELLKQARDSNRISDMSTIKSAISLYLADVATPSVQGVSPTTCYTTFATTTCSTWFPTATAQVTNNARVINGSGWVRVDFTQISSGAPVSQLPLDPVNSANYFYSYIGRNSDLTFKLASRMESTKYNQNGGASSVTGEGGSDPLSYEAGTKLDL